MTNANRPARVRFLAGPAAERIQARRDAAALADLQRSAQLLENVGLIHLAAAPGCDGLARIGLLARQYRASQRQA